MSILRAGLCFDADALHDARFAARLTSVDVLLFPELMDGGYRALRQGTPPHHFADQLISSLRNLSKQTHCTVVAGSLFLGEGTLLPTNTSLVFHRGRVIHRYDKIHLFKPAGDRKFFRPGRSDTSTFRISTRHGWLRAGVVICYDLRFPELIRALALRGLQILFVPARWPRVRDDAWQTLLKARAIENQIFVVGCNASDTEGGYSYAFDPSGKLIFSSRTSKGKGLHTFRVDISRLDSSRRLHRNLADAVFLKSSLR
ncbi:MAG: carbon-nitrogen family hydrolase [Bacteroidetes bacterium]|nr:carbon-nitrogen family hydrolase [Bacteroidota bacterium]MCW5895620.1 carbon-nitrogen family hydrolase [Bacteroidota bacterium]